MFDQNGKIKFCSYRLPCGMCSELKIECLKQPKQSITTNPCHKDSYTTATRIDQINTTSDCTHY